MASRRFLLPLNPGNGDDGIMMDYACSAMRPVWDAIEESGLPVTHHIGETPPKAPCEVNNVAVAMMVNIDGFREMFSKYIFGGILDRHPGLRIGWFEGGIAWIPPALQDAEHVLASYQHMLDHPLEHDIQYYWDTHMSASFIVDPLGLKLIEQIGVDKVMWSSDYPHNESSFGYSEKSLAAVVEPSARTTPPALSAATSKSSWVSEMTASSSLQSFVIPEEPDLGADASRHQCAASGRDGRPGRRRVDPVDERQRGVCHRRQLAGAGCRPVARRASGGDRAGR